MNNRRWAWLIGFGAAVAPVHNQWLTDKATTSDGETFFFLPAIGFLFLLMGVGLFINNNWEQVKANGLGEKKIWIPLLVIVAAMGLSGIGADGIEDKFAPIGMGIALFGLYLVARIVGKDIILPLVIGSVVASAGVIIKAVADPGNMQGGLVFEKNYNIAFGYIILAITFFVYNRKCIYSYVVMGFGLIGIALTGSAEAVFVVCVMAAVVLFQRDISKNLAYVILPAVAVVGLWFALGYGADLYSYTEAVSKNTTIEDLPDNARRASVDKMAGDTMLERRWILSQEAVENITPLGEGYNITNFDYETAHSVPAIIIQQLGYSGVLAMLAWLWVSFLLLFRSKYFYLWVLILALSVFDHFIWTQLGFMWWIAIGITVAYPIEGKRLFRGDHDTESISCIRT